jgi:hypothetical protein
MPGLNLGVAGDIRAGAQSRYGNSPAPTTAQAAAFGTANSTVTATAALTPTDGTGLAFWVGAAGIVGLLFIYYSLPGG